jgi:hypothetical protein
MNNSDGSCSCRKETQETTQQDPDDPGPWRWYPAALDVIGRFASSA